MVLPTMSANLGVSVTVCPNNLIVNIFFDKD
nr:MAG TPA: hypothetical protein [Caudoviricetes sp.]